MLQIVSFVLNLSEWGSAQSMQLNNKLIVGLVRAYKYIRFFANTDLIADRLNHISESQRFQG